METGYLPGIPAGSLERISSSDLENEVLITMYDGSISQISDHYKPFFRFRDIIHVNSYDTKMMMVNAGLGFGMIPDFIRLGKYDPCNKKELCISLSAKEILCSLPEKRS